MQLEAQIKSLSDDERQELVEDVHALLVAAYLRFGEPEASPNSRLGDLVAVTQPPPRRVSFCQLFERAPVKDLVICHLPALAARVAVVVPNAAFSEHTTLDVPTDAAAQSGLCEVEERLLALPRTGSIAATSSLQILSAELRKDDVIQFLSSNPTMPLSSVPYVSNIIAAGETSAIVSVVVATGVLAQNRGPLLRWITRVISLLQLNNAAANDPDTPQVPVASTRGKAVLNRAAPERDGPSSASGPSAAPDIAKRRVYKERLYGNAESLASASARAAESAQSAPSSAAAPQAQDLQQPPGPQYSDLSPPAQAPSLFAPAPIASSAQITAPPGATDENTINELRERIVQDILNLRCPRCGQVFVDYTNCDALTCHHCNCGFCALCLQDCGFDAHNHVQWADHHGNGIGLFGGLDRFNEYHRKRRERGVTEALSNLNLPTSKRLQLLEALRVNLEGLGISADGVASAVRAAPAPPESQLLEPMPQQPTLEQAPPQQRSAEPASQPRSAEPAFQPRSGESAPQRSAAEPPPQPQSIETAPSLLAEQNAEQPARVAIRLNLAERIQPLSSSQKLMSRIYIDAMETDTTRIAAFYERALEHVAALGQHMDISVEEAWALMLHLATSSGDDKYTPFMFCGEPVVLRIAAQQACTSFSSLSALVKMQVLPTDFETAMMLARCGTLRHCQLIEVDSNLNGTPAPAEPAMALTSDTSNAARFLVVIPVDEQQAAIASIDESVIPLTDIYSDNLIETRDDILTGIAVAVGGDEPELIDGEVMFEAARDAAHTFFWRDAECVLEEYADAAFEAMQEYLPRSVLELAELTRVSVDDLVTLVHHNQLSAALFHVMRLENGSEQRLPIFTGREVNRARWHLSTDEEAGGYVPVVECLSSIDQTGPDLSQLNDAALAALTNAAGPASYPIMIADELCILRSARLEDPEMDNRLRAAWAALNDSSQQVDELIPLYTTLGFAEDDVPDFKTQEEWQTQIVKAGLTAEFSAQNSGILCCKASEIDQVLEAVTSESSGQS
jgi:hypothetical protein